MRRLIGRWATMMAMAGAAIVAAQPAHAADASLSLRDLMAATRAVPPPDATAPVTTAATTPFRLNTLIDATPDQPRLITESQTAQFRRGYGMAMMDYFPFGADGFHISGGSRFYNRLRGRSTADTRLADLLYSPRSVLARASRRMTPALTMGYTKIVQSGLSLGIEGGAMLGKFDTLAGALVRPPRLREGLGDGAGRLNQVARLTLGFHF